jgi:MFS family permease
LIWAGSYALILAFGALLSLGSAFFSAGSWALLADLVPKDESARYFGLANLSTAGAAAAAGLFGPLMDAAGRIAPGSGYSVLFMAAALAFLAGILPMRRLNWKEVSHVQQGFADQGGPRTPRRGLAHLSLPAHPAAAEADQDPPRGPAGL